MGAAAIAVIVFFTGAPGPDQPPASGAAPAPEPLRPLPPLTPLPEAPNRAGPGPVSEFEPPPERPAAGTWEAVPMASRAAGLGAMGATVMEDLAELQDRIGGCFDENVQARHGRTPVSRSPRSTTDWGEGPAMLVLQIETRPGEARIVDAPVVSQGDASDGLIACAQQILRGHVIPLPGHTTTGKARLVFPLVP